eukprot:gene9275-biopygen3201
MIPRSDTLWSGLHSGPGDRVGCGAAGAAAGAGVSMAARQAPLKGNNTGKRKAVHTIQRYGMADVCHNVRRVGLASKGAKIVSATAASRDTRWKAGLQLVPIRVICARGARAHGSPDRGLEVAFLYGETQMGSQNDGKCTPPPLHQPSDPPPKGKRQLLEWGGSAQPSHGIRISCVEEGSAWAGLSSVTHLLTHLATAILLPGHSHFVTWPRSFCHLAAVISSPGHVFKA